MLDYKSDFYIFKKFLYQKKKEKIKDVYYLRYPKRFTLSQ